MKKSIKIKNLFSIKIVFLFLISTLTIFANNYEDKIVGNWYAEELDKSSFKVIKESNGTYSATITKSSVTSYIGKKVMKNVKYNIKQKQWEGTIISVSRNKEIDAIFILQNENKLKVIGSVFFFTKTFNWVRE